LNQPLSSRPAPQRSRGTPRGSSPNRRVEVSISHDAAGKRIVSLEDLSYGPGVGWYVQKTIRLDPEQVDALLRSLCCARQMSPCAGSGCRPGESLDHQVAEAGKILHLARPDDR
jgi:hypothetical protein